MKVAEYITSVAQAAHTIVEGMAVTFSHLLREPVTVQYPDKVARPVSQTLPQRYRGLLEVQVDICSGCRRCERSCPIEVISIELTKDPATKKPAMSRFDIDVGKCMFCGLCVEVCAQESLGALRHTREFEGATTSLDALVFRFIPPGSLQPLYKPPKDISEVRFTEKGVHAREARERALRDNPALLSALREGRPAPPPKSAASAAVASGPGALASSAAAGTVPAKPAASDARKPATAAEPKPVAVEAKAAAEPPSVAVEAKPVAVEAKAAAEPPSVAVEAKPVAVEAKPVAVEAKAVAAEPPSAAVEAKVVEKPVN